MNDMTRLEKFREFKSKIYVPIYSELMQLRPIVSNLEGNCVLRDEELNIAANVNLDPDLLEFYQFCERWELKWVNWKNEGVINLEGSFNFLPIDIILMADVALDPQEFPTIKNFTILDYYMTEYAVGFYLDQPEKGMFYYEMDADPQQMQLNFAGYLEMIKYTRGFLHWQIFALILANGNTIPIVPFKGLPTFEELNELFPDLSLDGFVKLYESVRIDR